MPDPQDKIAELASERHDQISGQLDWFESALTKLLANWQAEISEIVKELPSARGSSRLAELNYLKHQIGYQLQTLGYSELAQKFIGFYDEAEEAAVKQIEAAGIHPSRVAPLDQDALSTLKTIDLARFARAGENVISTLSEGIVLNTLGGLSYKKLIENVETALGEFQHLTVTYVNTGLVTYDRTVAWMRFSGLLEKFQYFGPDDIKTRPFCKAHVGKVYDKAEINQMDNGTRLLPVAIYGGGWNCRHVWSPWVGPIES